MEKAAGRYFTRYEIDGVMARRDRIVALIDDMVRKKGEAAVLFSDKRP